MLKITGLELLIGKAWHFRQGIQILKPQNRGFCVIFFICFLVFDNWTSQIYRTDKCDLPSTELLFCLPNSVVIFPYCHIFYQPCTWLSLSVIAFPFVLYLHHLNTVTSWNNLVFQIWRQYGGSRYHMAQSAVGRRGIRMDDLTTESITKYFCKTMLFRLNCLSPIKKKY